MKYGEHGIIRGFLITVLGIVMSWIAAPGISFGETQWDLGVSGGNNGIDGFHLSVGEYYDAPQREVVVIRDRGIRDEELPVVYHIARRAHVSPGAIVDLHLRGLSWMDVTLHYGLTPEIYYVPVTIIETDHHHPHGHAYGYYKKHRHAHEWRNIVLTDDDIIDQVNLRFMSNHYGYAPERIVKYRGEGRNFRVIDRDIRKEKRGHAKAKQVKHERAGSSHGDGKKNMKKGGNEHKNWKQEKHGGKGKD